jgi:hypothetical protein
MADDGEYLGVGYPPSRYLDIKERLRQGTAFCHGSVMFRKKILSEFSGPYRKQFIHGEDYDLWLRISEKYEMGNILEPLYKLRLSNQGVSERYSDVQLTSCKLARECATRRQQGVTEDLERLSERTFYPDLGYAKRINKGTREFRQRYVFSFELFANEEYRKARSQFHRLLLIRPLYIKIWIYWLLTFFPPGIIALIRRIKKKYISQDHVEPCCSERN